MTTLNEGNATRYIDGLSFESRQDWVIGETTANNNVMLSEGDTANVTESGRAVFIGQEAGSHNNTLAIEGTLVANEVYIGSADGNFGNMLHFGDLADFDVNTLYLAAGNTLSFEGDFSDYANLAANLDDTVLQVWSAENWVTLDSSNFLNLLNTSFDGTYTLLTAVSAVPEPAVAGLLLAISSGALILVRRRKLQTTQSL